MDDGIYYDMPEDEYRALPYVNQSSLKTLVQGGTPAHYKAAIEDDDKETDAKTFGKVVHSAILTPQDFEAVQPLPDDIRSRRGKAYDALITENPGITYLPSGEYVKHEENRRIAERIRQNFLQHPQCDTFMRECTFETVLIWTDIETGLKCKARLDMLSKDFNYIADIKTTSRPNIYMAARSAYNYSYQVQVAFYIDGLCTVKGIQFDQPPMFFYAFIESFSPYLCYVVDARDCFDERVQDFINLGYLELGRKQYRAALNTVAECEKTGVWDGYPLNEYEMVIPRYAESEF